MQDNLEPKVSAVHQENEDKQVLQVKEVAQVQADPVVLLDNLVLPVNEASVESPDNKDLLDLLDLVVKEVHTSFVI